MASEFEGGKVDGPVGTVSERTATAESTSGYKSPFVFEPVRRKMRLEAQDGVTVNTTIEQ